MDISALHLLSAIAQHGSFAAAARVLDLDPSSVSRVIANLENELSMRLFERTTRSLALTEAGTAYLDRIKPILADLD
ncbi:MAG: LysR family transcriptional regulator [Pseudomonadota bacterium]